MAILRLRDENGNVFPVPALIGEKGDTGEKGDKGDKPVRGTDYWTEADKAEIVNEVTAEFETMIDEKVADVQMNGASIVDENGIAIIPVVTDAKGGTGVFRVGNLSNGQIGVRNINGVIALAYPDAAITGLTNRNTQGSQYAGVVSTGNFDLAVKVAMTDGIGTAWTEEEQAAARTRMGAVSLEEVLAALPIYEGEVETV